LGEARGTCKGKEKYIQSFGGEKLMERDHLEDTGTDERIIIIMTVDIQDAQNGLD